MANPFFAAMGGQQGAQQGPIGMLQAFQKFMQQNQGKNPNEVLQRMISSGHLSQEQLNQAQQMAKGIEGQLSGFKSMFGFK